MPDDELFGLAAAGRLADGKVLEAQVRRMLAERSRARLNGLAACSGWRATFV